MITPGTLLFAGIAGFIATSFVRFSINMYLALRGIDNSMTEEELETRLVPSLQGETEMLSPRIQQIFAWIERSFLGLALAGTAWWFFSAR